jgi:predicted nuclease with TOPRIM domain
MFEKLKITIDKDSENKEIHANISSQLENSQNENKKLKEENKILNNKVKTLESELNKKKDKIDDLQHSLSVSNTKLSLIKLIVN